MRALNELSTMIISNPLPFFKTTRKIIFTILLSIFYYFFIHEPFTCFAMDEGGCLTCHQYPGLVRLEKSGKFRVLHIDEEKFYHSTHGKIDCRKCHTLIVKVPHTGETGVNCNTNCHLKVKDKDLVKEFSLSAFHKTEQSYIIHLDDKTSCGVCHALYPHSENKLVRALLNMHTGFMLCEVCHLKKDKFNNVIYDWKSSENAKFSGEPFGTYYNTQTGKARRTENFISRIAIYSSEKGKKRLVMSTRDTEKAANFKLKETKLKPGDKQRELEYFHRDIEKKKISVACDECHTSKSMLDFHLLGFSEKKINHLVYLNIKGLVTKYETFYFPHLFGR